MEPIFIIGTERSGTNLMRLILNSHSNIAVPHPPHILKNFSKLEPLYGDLENDHDFKKLIKDVVKMVELHPYPWDISIDKDMIFNSCRERNLINVFFSIYNQYLKNTQKKRWGCKSSFMIYYIEDIRRYYPEAKFIYMVRDGRDVAASAQRSIFNYYSVYFTARLWEKEQKIGIYWLENLSKDNIFLIKYEDLLNNPVFTVKSICLFLNEPYEETMLNFFETNEARKSSSLSLAWENTSRTILRNNQRKFQTVLSQREINLFEAIAGRELSFFSYELINPVYKSPAPDNTQAKFKIFYLLEELWMMLRIQIKYLLRDKNSLLRYRKFWFLKFISIARRLK